MIETEFSPEKLLKNIAEIENWFGRERVSGKYSSREMDIDILYFDELILKTKTLTIPHPQIANRVFVLVPLAEIAPEYVHPQLQMTSLKMLKNCPDSSVIKKVEL